MTGNSDLPDPYFGFQQGRRAVDRHMRTFIQAGQMWREDDATGILLQHAFPHVDFYRFNQREESRVGADWLWWWIDTTGTSFGLLAQGKILKRRGSGWHIDFQYRRRGAERTQIEELICSASRFGVPAAHVLYCGDRAYRAGLDCGMCDHHEQSCRERERAGVSIIASIVAQYLLPIAGADVAAAAFHSSAPLEDIADPLQPQPPLFSLGRVPADLARFLRQPQTGARRVAKAVLAPVHKQRLGQFSAALLDREELIEQALFQQIPIDRGHFSVPYLAHILSGLRLEPPAYIQDLLEGRTPPRWVTEAVAGIVIVHDPEPQSLSTASPAAPSGPTTTTVIDGGIPESPFLPLRTTPTPATDPNPIAASVT